MLKSKLKESQKLNFNRKDNYINTSKCQRSTLYDNIRFIDKMPKRNLPELRLTKIKIRSESENENEFRGKNINNTNSQVAYKTTTRQLAKKQKSQSLIKRTDFMFPKIKNSTNNGFKNYNTFNDFENNMIITNYNYFGGNNNTKKNIIHSTRNSKTKGLHVGNSNNDCNNINVIQNGFIYDKEKESFNQNYTVNIHNVKPKSMKYSKNNKSLPSKIPTKIKLNNNIKKEIKNENGFTNSLLINPISNYSNNSMNNINSNNYFFNTKTTKNNSIINNPINKINGKIFNKPPSQNSNRIPTFNNINSINKNNNINNINNNNIHNNINTNIPNLKTTNSKIIYQNINNNPINTQNLQNENDNEQIDDKINMLNNLLASMGGKSLFSDFFPVQKTVELSPEIFTNTYKNFEESIISNPKEFSENDIIKGYAYNTSMGNIRDYNEDTITAEKVFLQNDNNNDYFYFFGVYDGHGGNICSTYLKENLHFFIKEFSTNGLKNAINECEEQFMKTKALDESGELLDSSGSCGIICIIKNNKLIIANVGDSRLVIFKNNKVNFFTEDHKPNSEIEKNRIMKAGGEIYQTPSIFPLYQNGKEIEIPFRVLPGRLSVSRTFGDIEAKNEKFGGMKNVVAALPDITEVELNDEYNFIILGCDGIFDVLSNEELWECMKIVIKEKNVCLKEFKENKVNVSELCGDFAAMIIKSSLAKDSFDNVSCVVIAVNIEGLFME